MMLAVSVLLVVLFVVSFGHIRFSEPTPRSNYDSPSYDAPCAGFGYETSQTITEYEAGSTIQSYLSLQKVVQIKI